MSIRAQAEQLYDELCAAVGSREECAPITADTVEELLRSAASESDPTTTNTSTTTTNTTTNTISTSSAPANASANRTQKAFVFDLLFDQVASSRSRADRSHRAQSATTGCGSIGSTGFGLGLGLRTSPQRKRTSPASASSDHFKDLLELVRSYR